MLRFNPAKMLESIKGKRLVFVGDSINRNQWESMMCILQQAVLDPKRIYEAHGRRITKEKGQYNFKFVVCKLLITVDILNPQLGVFLLVALVIVHSCFRSSPSFIFVIFQGL